MQLKPVFFQVLYEPFLVVRILSTLSMFFHVPTRTGKCNKTLSCNLFGVILHIDSTRLLKPRDDRQNTIIGTTLQLEQYFRARIVHAAHTKQERSRSIVQY